MMAQCAAPAPSKWLIALTQSLKKHTQYAFLELKHKIITTNNEKACEGEPAEIGHEATHFIRYDLTGESIIMCEDETALLYNCFGPLTRNK